MNRHQFELPLGGGIDRGMTIIQYGHYGRPMLVFSSEAGRAWDFENNGMLDAIGYLINDGRIKLYCVDTLDARGRSGCLGDPSHRCAAVHGSAGCHAAREGDPSRTGSLGLRGQP